MEKNLVARVPSILLPGLDNYVTWKATDKTLHRGEGFVLCLSGVMDICSLCSLYSVLLISKVSSKGK